MVDQVSAPLPTKNDEDWWDERNLLDTQMKNRLNELAQMVTDGRLSPEGLQRELVRVAAELNPSALSDSFISQQLTSGTSDSGAALRTAVAQAQANRGDVLSTRGNPAVGVALDTTLAIPSNRVEVIDSVHEWWCWPIVTRIGRMTYGAGYGSNGEVLVWDRHDRDARPRTFVVGDAGSTGPGGEVDDHDAPARWMSDDGGFSIVVWSNHGDTDFFSVRASLDGSAAGFGLQPERRIVVAPGATISYNEIVLQSISGDEYTFWVYVRSASGWPYQVLTVNRKTGAYTQGPLRRGITIGGDQPYLIIAPPQGRTVRFAAYVNPQFSVHAIWLYTQNLDTGVITNVVDGSTFDTTSGSYLDISTQPPFVPETSAATTRRRLYYPHPTQNRVLYSEWVDGQEEQAQYREGRRSSGNYGYRALGPAAGPRNGYVEKANYNPGAAYSPDGTIIATLHNNIGAPGGEIRMHTQARTWLAKRTSFRLSRPVFVSNDELLFLAVEFYVDYFNFLMHQLSLVGVAAEISGAPATVHPLNKGAGTIFLFDPTFDLAWGDGLPTTVPNLAGNTDAQLKLNSIAGNTIAKRSGKGGRYFAGDLAAGGNQSITIEDQAARDKLVAAIAAGHKIVYAKAYRPVRAPASSYTGSPTHRHMGIISTTSADIATVRTTSAKTVTGYPAPATGEVRTGTTAPADGLQIVVAGVTGATNLTPGSSTAVVAQVNGGASSPAEARIDYVELAEDITVTGRTVAQVQAEFETFIGGLFATGGRYANDTWDTPPAR